LARVSASDDLSAAAVVVTEVTVRVDTDEGMLARARRVVLPASSLLSSVVGLAVDVALLPLLKRTHFL
jgi:hypothetical protein